jgi:hypothetical protein
MNTIDCCLTSPELYLSYILDESIYQTIHFVERKRWYWRVYIETADRNEDIIDIVVNFHFQQIGH